MHRNICNYWSMAGSILTRNDLRRYKPKWKEPVKVYLEGCNCTVYGPPPPSGAIVVQFILNVLDGKQVMVKFSWQLVIINHATKTFGIVL